MHYCVCVCTYIDELKLTIAHWASFWECFENSLWLTGVKQMRRRGSCNTWDATRTVVKPLCTSPYVCVQCKCYAYHCTKIQHQMLITNKSNYALTVVKCCAYYCAHKYVHSYRITHAQWSMLVCLMQMLCVPLCEDAATNANNIINRIAVSNASRGGASKQIQTRPQRLRKRNGKTERHTHTHTEHKPAHITQTHMHLHKYGKLTLYACVCSKYTLRNAKKGNNKKFF